MPGSVTSRKLQSSCALCQKTTCSTHVVLLYINSTILWDMQSGPLWRVIQVVLSYEFLNMQFTMIFDGIIFFSISRNTCRSFCNAKSESDKLIVALHNISCTWAVLCCAQIIVHKAFLFTKVLVYSAVQRPQKGTNKNLILKLTCTQRKWTVPGLNPPFLFQDSCRYQHSLGSLSGQATA